MGMNKKVSENHVLTRTQVVRIDINIGINAHRMTILGLKPITPT